MNIKLSEIFPEHFHEFWKKCLDPKITNLVLKGGRGSGKSSDIALAFVLLIMRWEVNGICIRNIDNTLRESVFEQIKWAIERLQVSHLFKFTMSPLKITYEPRGNSIIFRGAQDPEKLKSLKDSQFPYALAWIEEAAEFKSEDKITTVTNSILRDELTPPAQYKIFLSYNPPKQKQNWVNKKYETKFIPENTYINHSTLYENPYISRQMIQEAEAVKKRDEMRYKLEYLGLPVGSGIVPFPNLEIQKGIITDEMFNNFDNIRCGLDFGYSIDPAAFVVAHYDKKKRTVYIIDEIYGLQLSNRKIAEKIKEKGWNRQTIICDSAEPKSIAELKSYGLRAVPAKKGKDSITYGEKWLGDLDKIVIDPLRTPKTCWEFENIDYETDRNGEPKDRLEDKNNHSIDALRYAFNNDMNARNRNQVVGSFGYTGG